jgi:hypothetical protein
VRHIRQVGDISSGRQSSDSAQQSAGGVGDGRFERAPLLCAWEVVRVVQNVRS